MSRLVAFKPLFASPFGYANFGTENSELNKQLINDIETERELDTGKDRTLSIMMLHGNHSLLWSQSMRVLRH